MNKKSDYILIFTLFFLIFIGYNLILLLVFNLGLSEVSRSITIPLRFAVVSILIILVFKNLKRLSSHKLVIFFVIFSIFYCSRILVDYNLARPYYLDYGSVFFYFVSFSFLPVVCISMINGDKQVIRALRNSLFIAGILFSFAAMFYYGRFIGEVTRLATGTAGEDVISPLTLSYTSTLIIGLLIIYIMSNKVSKKFRVFAIVTILFSIPPFFLGASRGAIIALFLPFVIYFFSGKTFAFVLKMTFLFLIILLGLIYLDEYLGSGLLDRFTDTSEAVEQGASSDSRIDIWKNSWNQFLRNPLYGDKLEVNNWENYPHNIFLEVLQTTGLLGFIPFVIVMIKSWNMVVNILKFKKEYFWIAVIFIQAFSQSLFSGSVYSSAWLWASIGVLLIIEKILKQEKLI